MVPWVSGSACEAGKYQFDETSCVSCQEGHYQPASGQEFCYECAANTFSREEGERTTCLDCEAEVGVGSGSSGGSALCSRANPDFSSRQLTLLMWMSLDTTSASVATGITKGSIVPGPQTPETRRFCPGSGERHRTVWIETKYKFPS